MSPRRALRPAGLVLGAGIIVLAVIVALTPIEPDPTREGHGWRAAYYPDLLFLGEPTVRSEAELRFDWRRGSPFDSGRPVDRFSARWETCLDLPDPATITFTATSDDGSRVFVDGEAVVDNWGEHGVRARSASRQLDAGTHRVTVEYYEMTRDARVFVKLTLPDGEPVPIDWQSIEPCVSSNAPSPT